MIDQAVHGGEIDREGGQRGLAGQRIDQRLQSLADHRRLLADLLHHEMPVIALAHHGAGERRRPGRPLDRLAAVEEGGAIGPEQGPVVLLQIGDALGERGQRQSVGAQIHLALAEAHGERRAAPGTHHDVRPPGEDDRQGEGALQALHRLVHGLLGRALALQLMGQEMGDDLGIGLGLEFGAQGDQFVAELLEILDDAVVHDGDAVGGMGMGVGLARPAMGRPAGMADPHHARQR